MFLSLLFWIALMYMKVASREHHSVWCVDSLSDEQRDAQCTVRQVTVVPWSEKNASKTAPAPYSLKSELEVDSESRIRIKISWIQRDMKGVEGFHLELLHKSPQGDSKHYLTQMDLKNITSMHGPITFYFNCCGNPDSYPIDPEYEFVIKIQALPMYKENDSPQTRRTTLTIPACRDKVIRKAGICKKRRRPRQPRTRSPYEYRKRDHVTRGKDAERIQALTENTGDLPPPAGFWNVSDHILVIICSLIAALLVVVVVFLCRNRKIRKYHAGITFHRTKRGKAMVPSNVLLISTTHEDYLDVMNNLISIVRRFDHINLTTNLRSKVDIGTCGMTEWSKDRMLGADCVVLMPAFEYEHTLPVDEKQKKGSNQIAMAVSVAKNLITSQHIQAPQKKFFVADLNNCVGQDQLIFCKHYKLPKDLEILLKCLIGQRSCNVPAEDKKNFKVLLSSANCPRPVAEYAKELPPPNHENDLDYLSVSIENGRTAGTEDLNIRCDMESYRCVTMDFNTDESLTTRFVKAGARPKGQS